MKKLILFLCLALYCFVPGFAQEKNFPKDHKSIKKEIVEFKLKFMAQEMNLKEEQKKKFVDLYQEMWAEKEKNMRAAKALEKKLDDKSTEAEYEAASKAITAAKEKDAEIEKKYDAKFAEFLNPVQIYKMKQAEDQFRKKMHEMRHKKKNNK